MKTIMGYEYLWSEIRVKGGAYGCMSNSIRSGEAYFVSYRDPNLTRTIEVFEGAEDYIRNFDADEDEMTKYIIGTMSDIDVPLTPRIKGMRSLSAYLSGLTFEDIQREREEILAADKEDIRKMADYIHNFMADDTLCVIGNEEAINAAGDRFDTVVPLILQ